MKKTIQKSVIALLVFTVCAFAFIPTNKAQQSGQILPAHDIQDDYGRITICPSMDPNTRCILNLPQY